MSMTASWAGLWLENERFCCGSLLPLPAAVCGAAQSCTGAPAGANLINSHPLPALLCLHQRATFLMPRTCAAV